MEDYEEDSGYIGRLEFISQLTCCSSSKGTDRSIALERIPVSIIKLLYLGPQHVVRGLDI